MHELSIAVNLVELACEEARRHGAERVEALHLRLGPLSGVVREALLFGFDLATRGTAVEGARLEIEDVPLVVFCPECRVERELATIQRFRCPVCDTLTPEVIRGRELELFALEIADPEEITDHASANHRSPQRSAQEERPPGPRPAREVCA